MLLVLCLMAALPATAEQARSAVPGPPTADRPRLADEARAPLTADRLIAEHLEARGGRPQLEALAVLRRKGRLVIPGANVEIGWVDIKTRSGAIRQERTIQGLTAIQAFDGKEAWKVAPFEGRKDAERLPLDEAKPLILAADIDAGLLDYKRRGAKAAYLGVEDIEGSPAHKLRLIERSGDETLYFIDPDTLMIVRQVHRQLIRGSEHEVEIDYSGYEKIAGVYVPMLEELGPKGSEPMERRKFVFDDATANEELPPDFFSFPDAPKVKERRR